MKAGQSRAYEVEKSIQQNSATGLDTGIACVFCREEPYQGEAPCLEIDSVYELGPDVCCLRASLFQRIKKPGVYDTWLFALNIGLNLQVCVQLRMI